MSATKTTVTAKIPGLTAGDYTLQVKSSRIALDEGRVPYGEAELTVVLPELSVFAQITPYANLRVQITVTHEWVAPARAAQSRTFDLLLHERKANHVAGTLFLRAVTDEALLLDRRNISTTLARTYGLSVKDACTYALAIIGATLEAGAIDGTLTSKTLEAVRTNIIRNPRVGTGTTDWVTAANGGGTTTSARVATGGPNATMPTFYRNTIGTAAPAPFYVYVQEVAIPVTAGQQYTASAWVRSSVAVQVQGYQQGYVTNAGSTSGAAVIGAITTLAPNVWTRISQSFTADASATLYRIHWRTNSALAAASTIDFTGIMLTLGSDLIPYFDGAGQDSDSGLYTVAWTGTAHASTSTKTNVPNTDATIWQPGQSLDEWLAPILQAANRRLFCDELRKWRLVDASYGVAGVVTVSEGFNAKTGVDTMSRQQKEQGFPTWFDHVAVHYKWTDSASVVQEKWDFAGTGTVKGVLVEVSTPWPGPGAATAILARANGRGRTQDLTALTDYVATPGMAIVITMPGTPIQSGVTSAVTWTWDETTDEMSVGSRGLVATPANAWLFAAGAWSAATGSWSAATGTN